MKKALLMIGLLTMGIMYGCDDQEPTKNDDDGGGNQNQELCDTVTVTYNGHIKAIMDTKCNTSGCHADAAGGFTLGTYSDVKTAAEKENFLGAIKHEAGFVAMPLSGDKLDDQTIEKIECWEKKGFLEN